MTEERFNQVVTARCEKIQQILAHKAKEYAMGDRLHNFKVAARRRGVTPERALMGMKEKHSVSIEDIVDDLDKHNLTSLDTIEEKIGDEINYLILLEALLKERHDEFKKR